MFTNIYTLFINDYSPKVKTACKIIVFVLKLACKNDILRGVFNEIYCK